MLGNILFECAHVATTHNFVTLDVCQNISESRLAKLPPYYKEVSLISQNVKLRVSNLRAIAHAHFNILYIYIYIYICVCMYIYIYIYRERERDVCVYLVKFPR